MSRADLAPLDVAGGVFRHRVFERRAEGDTLYVLIEGDGRPWAGGGQEPATDPTPRDPLTLRLLLETPGPAFYVGRPCYFGVIDSSCRPYYWTHGRFAPDVVESMRRVVDDLIERAGKPRCVLIGHSGGAALALLIAPDLVHRCSLLTVAPLIDTAAWTEWHGYDPLEGSLNPSDSIERWRNLTQVHLVGLRDRNVPAEQTMHALGRSRDTTVVEFDAYDHGCCWVRDWPAILARIEPRLRRTEAVAGE